VVPARGLNTNPLTMKVVSRKWPLEALSGCTGTGQRGLEVVRVRCRLRIDAQGLYVRTSTYVQEDG
jgi:hypothetical protein